MICICLLAQRPCKGAYGCAPTMSGSHEIILLEVVIPKLSLEDKKLPQKDSEELQVRRTQAMMQK